MRIYQQPAQQLDIDKRATIACLLIILDTTKASAETSQPVSLLASTPNNELAQPGRLFAQLTQERWVYG